MAKMSGWICQDSYFERTAYLTDEQLGRLVRSLIQYHKDGTDKAPTGAEVGAYYFIKADIDAAERGYSKKCRTNSQNRGGVDNATTDDDRQRPITIVNDRPRPSTIDDDCAKNSPNYNINNNLNDNGKEKEEVERTREATGRISRQVETPPSSPTPAAGHLGDEISTEELEREQEVQETAERYVRKYGMAYNARTLEAVASDIRDKGAETVRAALDKAADSDHRGGISVNYYRAILNGTGGHGRGGRDSPGDMIRHTKEEFMISSAAAVVDLDDEEGDV